MAPYYTSGELRALQKMRGVLHERLAEMNESALRTAKPDYAAYMEQVGRYHGLKEAIELLDSEIETEQTR